MSFLAELILYYIVKTFGAFIRLLPVNWALGLGRLMGRCAYYFDVKHKSIVQANLKIAFADTKSPREIRKISKELFKNYGQNLIELFRLPLMTQKKFSQYVKIEGKEHVDAAVKKGKGVILLAMHFGSWEMASLTSAMMGYPYRMIVKPQKRFSRLDALLNSYRECSGSDVIEKGSGTREFIKGLNNNEVIALVVDQGGRDGMLVPFFNRQASMSVGAIRVGLKMGVPICFVVILREKGPYHRMVIHPPLVLEQTDEMEKDIRTNLVKVTKTMEDYIRQRPEDYMWFYKIWKYSKESVAVILSDGKTGHLRQSQAVAGALHDALKEREITATIKVIDVKFKSPMARRALSVLGLLASGYLFQGRVSFLRWFLTEESYTALVSTKADFIVSCGSSSAAVNYFLSNDEQAKSIAILKPGLLSFSRFDLVVLPQHDNPKQKPGERIVVTRGAPNLITKAYLEEQTDLFLKRFSHLQLSGRYRIGVLIGGDTKNHTLNEQRVRQVIHQIKEVAQELDAEILLTTSRRTSEKIESMLMRELKKYSSCRLLILASRNNVPEAVGGILGLSDIVVVSGDSISMISEASTSGKRTVVFPVQSRLNLAQAERYKHDRFIDRLHSQGYILSSDVKNVRQAVYELAKNKIQTKPLDDHAVILEAVKRII